MEFITSANRVRANREELVHSMRAGRENLFAFGPAPLAEIKKYIDLVSEQWDQTLSRLKSFVEH